jgi:hypothetical protein
MAKLDHLKEEIAYFRFWLGIVAVTDIGLVGWLLVTVDVTDRLRLALALLGIPVLSSGAVFLHRQISERIERIREL